MRKPEKSAGEKTRQQTVSAPKTQSDMLKDAAQVIRNLPDTLCPQAQWEGEKESHINRVEPDEYWLKNAGGLIRTILEQGAFPEIGKRILPTFDNLRAQQSANKAYPWLWEQTVKILRRRYELCPSDACIESFAKDCQLVADELDKEAQALASKQPTEASDKSETEKREKKAIILTEKQLKILKYLKEIKTAVAQVDIEVGTGISKNTISKELKILKGYDFVSHPKEKKRHVVITQKGIDYLNSLK